MSKKYCNSLTKYSRYKTRIVNIGDIPIGGTNPIRIQSMTTTNTLNISETINQSIRIFNAGSDYVRITAPSIKEAKALKKVLNLKRTKNKFFGTFQTFNVTCNMFTSVPYTFNFSIESLNFFQMAFHYF